MQYQYVIKILRVFILLLEEPDKFTTWQGHPGSISNHDDGPTSYLGMSSTEVTVDQYVSIDVTSTRIVPNTDHNS